MGEFGKCHLIILTNAQLPDDKISFIKNIAATVDVVSDVRAVASQAETASTDAIIIIQDSEKDSCVARNLRENANVDQVPILAVKSIEEAVKLLPLFLASKL